MIRLAITWFGPISYEHHIIQKCENKTTLHLEGTFFFISICFLLKYIDARIDFDCDDGVEWGFEKYIYFVLNMW